MFLIVLLTLQHGSLQPLCSRSILLRLRGVSPATIPVLVMQNMALVPASSSVGVTWQLKPLALYHFPTLKVKSQLKAILSILVFVFVTT